MSTKLFTFDLRFILLLNDNEESWNHLPESLPAGVQESVAKEFTSLEDYYDGFTDMLIESCGCDVEEYRVEVVPTSSNQRVTSIDQLVEDAYYWVRFQGELSIGKWEHIIGWHFSLCGSDEIFKFDSVTDIYPVIFNQSLM